MSVTSSRLRHHGVPGLQAQKWLSTEKISASAIVTGTTLVKVWVRISTISMVRVDMSASWASEMVLALASDPLAELA